jgi:hypothetical protein
MRAKPDDWLIVRWARLLRPAGNPLARGADRLEGAAVLLSVLLALVLVPVMLTVGSLTYGSLDERSEQQASAGRETVAVLTKDASPITASTRGDISADDPDVPARWQMPDGTVRTGVVQASNGLKAGAEVSVWLDESGQPMAPPLSTADAVMTGVVTALFGWCVAVGLLALACWALHRALDRRRYRAWQTEWARVEPEWHHRSQ